MTNIGKILCTIIGLIFGGIPGAIIGFIIGVVLDQGIFGSWLNKMGISGVGQQHTQQIFFATTFRILGFVAKADGRVSEREIQVAQQVMTHLGLNSAQRRQAIEYFNEGKSNDFDWQMSVRQLKRACLLRPMLLKTFLEVQIQIAFADGNYGVANRTALEMVCRELGISASQFQQFEQQYKAQQNYQRTGRPFHGAASSQLGDAYKILGVSRDAEQSVVKKAYRKLMSENHPDKLIAKGLPEEMIKLANEKTAKIKQAYEDICKAKGWL